MASPAPHEASPSTPRGKKKALNWLPHFDPSRLSSTQKQETSTTAHKNPGADRTPSKPKRPGKNASRTAGLTAQAKSKPVKPTKPTKATLYISPEEALQVPAESKESKEDESKQKKPLAANMSRTLTTSKTSSSHLSDPNDDICPVCKSNRYLNPKLEFQINSECYHKMCSTCVDRIFTSGPASCPVPYCGKTLRKKGFHKAFFADLRVEREVDVRRRVGKVFNRRQDEFETLRDWNNYLEEVEGLIFDIMEGRKEERAKAEEKLRAYRESNLRDIEDNTRAGLEAVEIERRREVAAKEAARQRRLAALQEAEEERKDIAMSRNQVLDRLANSDEDATKITAQAQKVILKKTSARRNLMAENENTSAAAMEGLSLRGLKKKVAPAKEKPYDPFGGLVYSRTRYILQDEYPDYTSLDPQRTVDGNNGGWSVKEYTTRCMHEAFAGLGIIIEDEDPHSSHPKAEDNAKIEASTIKVESAMDVDDVF